MRQRFKPSKLSVVFLGNFLGTVIKPQEAHYGLHNQGRLNLLFNRDLFLQGLREHGNEGRQ